MNHYEFLGVPRDASDKEIKTAYKNMAKKYHPDVYRGGSGTAHEKMQEINAVYNVLSDNAKREEYDYSLWLEERKDPDEIFAERYGVYEKYVRPKPQSTRRKPFKPSSKAARRIMRVVWAVRIIIPLILIYITVGIMFRLPSMMDTLDRIYGRGTPARVTELYFDSLKERDFERNEQLTGAGMTEIRTAFIHAARFEAYGVAFGELWLGEMTQSLKVTVLSTERRNFSSASVSIRVSNLDMERLFIRAQNYIINDLRQGTGEPLLRQAVATGDISLIGEVYSIYLNNLIAYSPEYMEADFTLLFSRPGMWWNISGADDAASLRNLILGGFGDAAARNSFNEYMLIDWHDELGTENEAS
jgi:curved DNA-binding protein CbpA